MINSSLEKSLKKVDKIFKIDDLINQKIDANFIKKYYKESGFGYKYFHSKEGAMHMSLDYDGEFNEQGYKTHLKEISEHVNLVQNPKILELASGKGFNSRVLHSICPNSEITGIDFTKENLDIANKLGSDNSKLNYIFGDFHQIPFEDMSYDFVYELESVCYASDHIKVLEEIYRVLKNGGKYIMYEGFRANNFDSFDEELKTATYLVEKTMAVDEFIEIEKWIELAKNIGFEVEEKNDLSYAIVPTLNRLRRIASGFFKFPPLSIFLKFILPKQMIKNSVAGLLMPYCVQNSLLYYKVVLIKK